MSPEREGTPDGAVPDELLRAGVYVPEPRVSLAEAASRALEDPDAGGTLLHELAADPALLDEAVGWLAGEAAERCPGSLLPARRRDLLLAAPVANRCGVPLRGPGRGPGDGEAELSGPLPAGERVLVVMTVHDGDAWRETAQAVRRAGGEALGPLSVVARPGDARQGGWSAVEP